MIGSLNRLLRNGAFRTAAVIALALLLVAVLAFQLAELVPATFSPENRPPVQSTKQETDVPAPDPPKNSGEENLPILDERTSINIIEAILSGLILAFLVIVIFSIKCIFKNRSCDRSGEMERLITVTIVVMGALFLIISGRKSEHIAPAFGLLGMVSGYLLGQARARKEPQTGEVDEKP